MNDYMELLRDDGRPFNRRSFVQFTHKKKVATLYIYQRKIAEIDRKENVGFIVGEHHPTTMKTVATFFRKYGDGDTKITRKNYGEL